MFTLFKKIYNLLTNNNEINILSVPRSNEWAKVRKLHLLKEPFCMVCGGSKNLQVHHLMPVHVDPSKELDPENLITLCNGTVNCHLIWGHLLDYKSYSTTCKEDAKIWNEKIKNRKKNEKK